MHMLKHLHLFVVICYSLNYKRPPALSQCEPGVGPDLKQLLPIVFKSKDGVGRMKISEAAWKHL